MNKFRFTINVLAIAAFTLAFASFAQAQATRTWVSGVGDDANPCSRTAPCKTFAGAISKTAVNGEINCIDSGGFGVVTITKSIIIDGANVEAGVLNAGTNGINVATDSITDSFNAVRLRNLDIHGAGTGTRGISITGSRASTKVYIENCVIDGQNTSPGIGISDTRTGAGTFLGITNTTVRNTLGDGILIKPASGSNTISASVTNSRVYSTAGSSLHAGAGANVSIAGSTFSGSATGIFADNAGGNATQISLDNCQVTSNGTGLNASTSGTNIFVSNSTIMFNTTISVLTGTITSYGNNMSGGAVFSNNSALQR